MGSLSTFRLADDPFAVIQNPAYLGVGRSSVSFNAGFFSPRTHWLPGFSFADMHYDVQIASFGVDLASAIDLPVSVGVGYSRVRLDLGTFAVTGPGPEPLGTIDAYEMANDYSIGIGADIGLRLAAGFTLRHLETNLASVRTSSTDAYSVGFLSSVPVHALLPAVIGSNEIFPSIRPTLDITAGLVFANYGDSIRYGVSSFDPLPRMVSTGLSVELGVTTTAVEGGLKVLSAALSHSARELLVTRDTTGAFHYVPGVGHLNFARNILRGIRTDALEIAKGWEVSILEFFAVRGGSYSVGDPLSFASSGWSIRSAGLLKILGALTQNVLFTDIGNRVDVRYDCSKEANADPENPRDGTSYSALSFLVRI